MTFPILQAIWKGDLYRLEVHDNFELWLFNGNTWMISYQGPAGACDGRAQGPLGYRSGGRSGQARLITSRQSDSKLVSQPCHIMSYYTDFTCTALALKNRRMSPGWARQKYLEKNNVSCWSNIIFKICATWWEKPAWVTVNRLLGI